MALKKAYLIEKISNQRLDIAENLLLGRRESDSSFPDDVKMSRRHALIECKSGRYFLRDLKSANGTYLNGEILYDKKSLELRNLDEVRVGSTNFVFHQEGGELESSRERRQIPFFSGPRRRRKVDRPKRRFLRVAGMVLSVWGLLWTGLVFLGRSHKSSQPPMDAELVAQIKSAVVKIEIKTNENASEASTIGSGFFISGNGLVVTNRHVVESIFYNENAQVSIKTFDGKTDKAPKIVLCGPSLAADLCILQSSFTQTPFLKGDTRSKPEIGEAVFVVGHPAGLEFSVASGIVSNFYFSGKAPKEIEDFGGNLVQISAPISQGNSGGPIVNRRGEVVGVTTYSLGLVMKVENINFGVAWSEVARNMQNRNVASESTNVAMSFAENFRKNLQDKSFNFSSWKPNFRFYIKNDDSKLYPNFNEFSVSLPIDIFQSKTAKSFKTLGGGDAIEVVGNSALGLRATLAMSSLGGSSAHIENTGDLEVRFLEDGPQSFSKDQFFMPTQELIRFEDAMSLTQAPQEALFRFAEIHCKSLVGQVLMMRKNSGVFSKNYLFLQTLESAKWNLRYTLEASRVAGAPIDEYFLRSLPLLS